MADATTDFALTTALKCGDKEAFEALFTKYREPSRAFVRSKVLSDEVAEEIVQEVFADIWDRREKAEIQHFAFYLHRALRYRVINHINTLIRKRKYRDYYAKFVPVSAHQTQLDVSYNFLSEMIEEVLGNLPEKTQQIFRMSKLKGKSLMEIAASLNLTEKTIQYHLTKSVKAMRVRLKDYILLLILASGFIC